MLLNSKTAIVYGASGAIGSHVARAFAREGATVHVVGRHPEQLEDLVEEIRRAGGTAYAATFDVLECAAVEVHAESVAKAAGIDVCFNATSNEDVQGSSLVEMELADLVRPVYKAVSAHFNIATAVGRHMMSAGGGVILVMAGGREAIPRLGGSHVAWAALAG